MLRISHDAPLTVELVERAETVAVDLAHSGVDRVRHMATDVTLYVGSTPPNYAKFRFRDAHEWEGVRAQIINAMKMGKGTIEIDRKGDKVVYVYSPFLAVSWVETGV